MTLRWLSCSMTTGEVITELPTFVADYPIRVSLSTADTASGKLYLEPMGAPPNVPASLLIPGSAHTVVDNYATIYSSFMLDAIHPRRRWLVCYDDFERTNPIRWVGFVSGVSLDTDNSYASVRLTSAEGYLDRRYVHNKKFLAGTSRRRIVRDLLTSYITPHVPVLLGDLGEVDDSLLLDLDLYWQNADDATVLGRLTELIGHFGGEFRIRWSWSGNKIVGRFDLDDIDNIGFYGPPPDLGQPVVTFDFPGSARKIIWDRDDSDGKGANTIVAKSDISGSGVGYTSYEDPLRVKNLDPDEPPFEYRYSPGSNIKPAELAKFARLGLRVLRNGAQTYGVEIAREDMATRHFNRDYHLGDTVALHILSHDWDGRPILQFPHGLRVKARVIAHEIYEDYEVPVLADRELYVINTDMDSSMTGNGSGS